MPQMEFGRILDNPHYSVRAMSDAIINVPTRYKLLSLLRLFPDKGIRTTYVEIHRKNKTLNILPTTERGGAATKGRRDTRDKILVGTQYISHEDQILADDIQNLPAFGSDEFFESFDMVVNEKLENLFMKYEQTFENQKWGALRGDVLDADGSVLYNSYDIFNITQASFDFKFGTTTSDGAMKAAKDSRRYVEKEKGDEPMNGMVWFCGPGFMDKLTAHPSMAEAYRNQQSRPNPLLDDMHDGFRHGGATYIEHNGTVASVNPETGVEEEIRFIAENEAIGIPFGTSQVFRSYFAPGTMMTNVNMPGQAIYVSPKLLDHGRGIEMFSESAPLFLVQKPQLVIRGYSSN